MNLYQKQDGFTLVELMVGIIIMGLLTSALLELLNQSFRAWKANSHITEVQQTAQFAVNAIVNDARYAQRIVINSDTDVSLTASDNAVIRYYIDTSVSNENRLMRKKDNNVPEPVTGENHFVKVSIQKLVFSAIAGNGNSIRTLGIDLLAQDAANSRYSYKISTAITANNVKGP